MISRAGLLLGVFLVVRPDLPRRRPLEMDYELSHHADAHAHAHALTQTCPHTYQHRSQLNEKQAGDFAHGSRCMRMILKTEPDSLPLKYTEDLDRLDH